MKRSLSMACLLAAVVLFAGCAKKNVHELPEAGAQVGGDTTASTQGQGDPSTSGSALGGDVNGSATNGAGGAGGDTSGGIGGAKIIYFDFDKSEIKPEFADIVSANAKNLTSHPNLKLKLEGSTDERGTREYNIGLGERRAQAVRRALMLQGAAENQVTTVSFGAERPAAEGDDEAAWSQNRRVELVYLP